MRLHVLAKEGRIGESQFITNLLDAEVSMLQIVADVLQHVFTNPLISGLTGFVLTHR